MSSKRVVRSAIIAAMYIALCFILKPISYGTIQFRLAEALCVLPLLMIEGVWGLAIGCFVVNIFSPFAVFDMIFGTLVTLVSAILTRALKKYPLLAILPPILLNAFCLPVVWFAVSGDLAYWANVLSVFISETIIIAGIGTPFYYIVRKNNKLVNKLSKK